MSGCLADSKINEYDKAFQLLDRSKEVYKSYEMYSYLANTYAEIGNASKNLNMFSKTLIQ